jgi:hypothetical protein
MSAVSEARLACGRCQRNDVAVLSSILRRHTFATGEITSYGSWRDEQHAAEDERAAALSGEPVPDAVGVIGPRSPRRDVAFQ